MAAESFAAVVEKSGIESEPNLNLAQATLSFGGRSDGMELPAVRIPIGAITTWWIAGGAGTSRLDPEVACSQESPFRSATR